MAFEVKRASELSLATLLTEAIPGSTFYVSKGGTETGGTTKPVPPFGVVWIDDAQRMFSYVDVYYLRGSVVWITRAEQQDVAEHSDAVKQIYQAMLQIGSGIDDAHNLAIHGVDVDTVNEFSDTERLAHGDVISFTMGVSELVVS